MQDGSVLDLAFPSANGTRHNRSAHNSLVVCVLTRLYVAIISYEEQLSLVKLKQVLEERLEDYNMEPKLVSMQLVLFKVCFYGT